MKKTNNKTRAGQTRPFCLLIKPASADCNLRCEYCFYLEKSALYPESAVHRMSDSVLERVISSYMATDQPCYSFGWQGGEPTLMGVDFFRRATDLQARLGRAGATVGNGLQTNATLITDELAAHLAKYKFLAGVSIDGPGHIHDRFRRRVNGGGSHSQTLKGIAALRRHGVEFNALTLVSAANVKAPREVFRYLCGLDIFFHQYIPCVEYDGSGGIAPFAITGEEWGDFMCEIYDEWLACGPRNVSVRLFDSILSVLVDGLHTVCHTQRNCCQYFMVEYNGDIYPCDFFARRDLLLGNIMETGWSELQNSERYIEFGRAKRRWNKVCDDCPYLFLCAGDCLKHRHALEKGPEVLGSLCEGWRRFYAHALPGLRELAETVKQERAASNAGAAGPMRNDLCPCGSGKKYKRCCGS